MSDPYSELLFGPLSLLIALSVSAMMVILCKSEKWSILFAFPVGIILFAQWLEYGESTVWSAVVIALGTIGSIFAAINSK
jgi:hypothetical protein